MMVRSVAVLTCQELVELVSELLDGALAPTDRVPLEQHLLVCPPCTAHVAQVKSTIALAAELRAPAAAATPAVLAAFHAWKQQ